MAQKNSKKGFRRYAITGSAAVAGLVGVLLALTYAQPQRQDIIQDKPQGAAGP
jgi:hypothetical protein